MIKIWNVRSLDQDLHKFLIERDRLTDLGDSILDVDVSDVE